MNFEWDIQPSGDTGSIEDLKKYLYEELHQAEVLFMLNTIVPLYSVYTAENLTESLVKVSKESFFCNPYSEDQYQHLLDF